ncbi:tata-binding protein-associated factor btaf1 [Quercus suber]|uniref:Tata-binding protein-associated factor btaf1 n=1 Tax=Quercus suber TaxID=58331 RepID=A0AAW0LUD1_QUESU
MSLWCQATGGAYNTTSKKKPFLDVSNDEDSLELDGDGRWPFRILEVHRGSVMALREILTHQGASAGVFMPDLSWDGALFVELKDKGISNTMKRERLI